MIMYWDNHTMIHLWQIHEFINCLSINFIERKLDHFFVFQTFFHCVKILKCPAWSQFTIVLILLSQISLICDNNIYLSFVLIIYNYSIPILYIYIVSWFYSNIVAWCLPSYFKIECVLIGVLELQFYTNDITRYTYCYK